MRIAMLSSSMSRVAGGLFLAVQGLSLALQAEGEAVSMVAAQDEHSDADRATWRKIDLEIHDQIGPRSFAYQPGLMRSPLVNGADVLHQHGLWMYPSLVSRRVSRLGKPVLISPHGMLDPWAVQNSGWKKRIAERLYERENLERARCLHALNHAEFAAIRAYGLRNPVAVIPNGVDLSLAASREARPTWAKALPDQARILLYLGRIHPKKGLSLLVKAFAAFVAADPSTPWVLIIAGWETAYANPLRNQVDAAGLADKIRLVGPQFGADKVATMQAADAFILPSLSEGLPMAVLEAWSFQLPVILTPDCNLPEGKQAGAAMEVAAEPEALAKALAELAAMPQDQRQQMGLAGRRLVEGRFAWSRLAGQMRDVYEWLCVGGEKPACVMEDDPDGFGSERRAGER